MGEEIPKWKQQRDAVEAFFEKLKPTEAHSPEVRMNVELLLEAQHPESTNVGHALTEDMLNQQATILRQVEASIGLTLAEDPTLELSELELRIGSHIEVWARGEPKYHIFHMTVADSHQEWIRFNEAREERDKNRE